MLASVKRIVLSYGFAVWLWAFLFARVPLAVIQEYSGLASRPFVLINIISLCIAFFVGFDRGLKNFAMFNYRPISLVLGSFAFFWLIYFFRLGFDSYLQPIEFIETPFSLSKSFVISTLIPVLCLPWIFSIRSNADSLVICSVLGNISVLTGIIAFFNKSIIMDFNIHDTRLHFEDLNPIPAGHSSASLVILGIILLLYAHKKKYSFGLKFIYFISTMSIFLGLWGVRLSQTRSAYIALLPVIIFCFCQLWKEIRYRWLLISVASLCSAWALPIKRTFTNGLLLQDDNVAERVRMFSAVWEWICAHPFFGVGFNLQSLLNSLSNTTGSHWYPHNIFLDTYGIGGLLLFIPLLVFAFSLCRSIWFLFSSGQFCNELYLVLAFLWIQSLFLSCFSGHMTLLPGFWVGGLMLPLACARDKNFGACANSSPVNIEIP